MVKEARKGEKGAHAGPVFPILFEKNHGLDENNPFAEAQATTSRMRTGTSLRSGQLAKLPT
eukprot:6016276-Prorocentrum_lima.AAC.1